MIVPTATSFELIVTSDKPSFYEQVTDVKLLFLLSFIGLLLLLLVRLRRMLFSTEFLFALC
jgi:hypothetical protein